MCSTHCGVQYTILHGWLAGQLYCCSGLQRKDLVTGKKDAYTRKLSKHNDEGSQLSRSQCCVSGIWKCFILLMTFHLFSNRNRLQNLTLFKHHDIVGSAM